MKETTKVNEIYFILLFLINQVKFIDNICKLNITCYNLIVVINMKGKKQKRKIYKTNSSSDMEYGKIIKITIGVIIVLALTYFITALASGEIKFGKEKIEEKETSIQYEEIMVGQMLNRKNNEYYVMLFNFTDTYASYYLSLKDNYSLEDNALPFYIIDLEKYANKEYVYDESEKLIEKPVRLVDFKASSPTIIKIKDKKIVERITGKEEVLKFFK